VTFQDQRKEERVAGEAAQIAMTRERAADAMGLVVAQAEVVEWAVLPGRRFFVGHQTGPFVVLVSVLDWLRRRRDDARLRSTHRADHADEVLVRILCDLAPQDCRVSGLASNPSAATPFTLENNASWNCGGGRIDRPRACRATRR
jgi:hypothetical protein